MRPSWRTHGNSARCRAIDRAGRGIRAIPTLVALLGAVAAFAAASPPAGAADEPRSPRWLIERGRWSEARERLEAAGAANSSDPQLLGALAEVRAAYGEIAEAQKLAERAVELAPGDGAVRATLADIVGEQAGRAGALKAMGLAKRFRREAEAAIALDPTLVPTRRGLMEFHLRAPGIAGGDRKQVPVQAAEIAKLDPVEGELALARVAQHDKDSVAVERHFRRAVELGPRSVSARMALASWCAAPWRDHLAEAGTHARAAFEADPDRPATVALLVVISGRQGRWEEVEKLLELAAASFPADRGGFYQAGRIALTAGGDLARAERWFRQYLERTPGPGQPSEAHARWRLAQVLEKQGRKGDAVAELRAAVRLKPDLQEAKKDLKRLGG